MVKWLGAHFEILFHASLWLNASLLAALVGRPWLALVGLGTVLPFLIAYRLSGSLNR